MIAEAPLDRHRFSDITQGCGGAVRVDVVDIVAIQAGIAQRVHHTAHGAFAILAGCRNVMRIGTHAVTQDFRKDSRATIAGVLEILEYQRARAFADDKTITIFIEGPAGVSWIVVTFEPFHSRIFALTQAASGDAGRATAIASGAGRFDGVEVLGDGTLLVSGWNDHALAAAWIGHATVLLRIGGLTVLTDPVFSTRIGVGLGAVALGYTGYLHSLAYARQRAQGRLAGAACRDPASPQAPIIGHADVKRMLLAQKAYVEGGLALNLYCARLVDQAALAAVEDYARQHGCIGVMLHVFGTNTGARALYGKAGYDETNVMMLKRV